MNIQQHRSKWRAEWREAGTKQRESFATEQQARMFCELADLNGPALARRFVRGEVEPAALRFPTTPPAAPAGAPTATTSASIVGLPGDHVLLKPYARQHLAQKTGVTERTLADEMRVLEQHVFPYWCDDDLTLGQVRQKDRTDRPGHRLGPDGNVLSVSGWIQWLSKREGFTNAGRPNGRPLSPKTISNIHTIFSGILQAAVTDDDQLLTRNPCATSKLPENQTDERVYLEAAQFEALLQTVDPHFRLLLLFLVLTGVRWGEAAGLPVKHVHLHPATGAPFVAIRVAWRRQHSGQMQLGRVKSSSSVRDISLPAVLVPLLEQLLAGKGPDEPVFTMRGGGRLHHGNFTNRFLKPAAEAAGVPVVRAHAFRHTHVAWLIAADVPMLAISRRLGHHDEYFTSKRYGHLLDRVKSVVLSALDAILPFVPAMGPSSAATSMTGSADTGHGPSQPVLPVLPSAQDVTAQEQPELFLLDDADAALPELDDDEDDDDVAA